MLNHMSSWENAWMQAEVQSVLLENILVGQDNWHECIVMTLHWICDLQKVNFHGSQKVEYVGFKCESWLIMLFQCGLRWLFHRCYETSVRLTSGLRNICHSCCALLNWTRLASLTPFTTTSCGTPRKGERFRDWSDELSSTCYSTSF